MLFLHRFAMPDLGIRGHDLAALSRNLEYLRLHRYNVMSVPELLAHLDQGTPLRENALVFTVDDGYADFAEAGAPIFAAYDCPVTVFLVTDFVAGRLWNWYDRVAWAFTHSARREVSLDILGERIRSSWTTPAECERASENTVERLKQVTNTVKDALIQNLETALEVEIPVRAPEQYRAMSWDQVRSCGRQGATFGPHTVSHPILSQVDAGRSDREISESWHAVAEATDAAVPVFGYPNGTIADFSAREKASVARAGMTAAVATTDSPLEASISPQVPIDRFAIPRLAYAEQKSSFVQIASGLQAVKARFTKRFG